MAYTKKVLFILTILAIQHMVRQLSVRYLVADALLRVHNDILAKIIRAPINLFFDITPTGLILNRFNNDMRCFEHVVH